MLFARKEEGSRGPNRSTPFPFGIIGEKAFKTLSWNARGIALRDPFERSRMFERLRNLSIKAHIICLQEVHGLKEEFLADIRSCLPGWGCFHSPPLSPDGIFDLRYAGVAILVCPILTQISHFDHRVLVDGRAQMLNITFSLDDADAGASAGVDFWSKTLTPFNIHKVFG